MGIIKVTMTTSFLTTQSMMAEYVGTQILSRKYFFVVIYKYIDTDIHRDIYIVKCQYMYVYMYSNIFNERKTKDSLRVYHRLWHE